MAVKTKEQLKSQFETGDVLTEESFNDLIDTMATQESIEKLKPLIYAGL